MPLSRDRGRRLRSARNKAMLSQEYVAEQVGCSRQLVGVWERGGAISADQLKMLCVLYRCTSDSILFDQPGEPALATSDSVARQFALLEPVLRSKLWMLYQVFVRPGADTKTATDGV